MNHSIKAVLAVVAFSLCLSTHALAGDFEDGYAALQRGDLAMAHQLYLRAATRGHVGAQFNLGLMYYRGEGVPQDYAEAVKWHRRAAEQGLAPAQVFLGVMYELGEGVPQDYVQAHKWINLGAAAATAKADRDNAVHFRDSLAERMTTAQIAEAQKLAREWKPQDAR